MNKRQRFINAASRAVASGSGHLGALGVGLILAGLAAYIASTIGTSQLNNVPSLALARNDEQLLSLTDQFAFGLVVIGALILSVVVAVYVRKRAASGIAGTLLVAGSEYLTDLTSNRISPMDMAVRAIRWSSYVERSLRELDPAFHALFTLGGSLRVRDQSVGATFIDVEEFLERRTTQLATILTTFL